MYGGFDNAILPAFGLLAVCPGNDALREPVIADARLPLDAIVRPPDDRNDFAVYVVQKQGGKTLARLRKVRLGQIVGNDITVSSGVQIGDQVIMRGRCSSGRRGFNGAALT